MAVKIYLTTGTKWVAPNNIGASVTIEGIAGGAGGDSAGGAGGGGQYFKKTGASLTAGVTYTYAIGQGGAAGIAGGNTTFTQDGAVKFTAHGGSAPSTITGGAGGTGATGATSANDGGAGGSLGSANPGGGG